MVDTNLFLKYHLIIMALSKDDLEKIAKLAHLKPTEKEKERLLADLNKILEYMEIINESDIEEITELQPVHPQSTPFRDDKLNQN